MRTIALFEAGKGLLVLLVGFGLLTLLHRDIHALAIKLSGHLHLNPSKKFAGVFIAATSQVTDKELWLWASIALCYSALRLIEGYGLWQERTWAEWLALLSGMIYLPLEIYMLVVKPTWEHVSVLTANLLVVVFMALVLWLTIKTRRLESAVSRFSPPQVIGNQ